MFRKLLVCLGTIVVLATVAVFYSARIPTERRNANEVFESVAIELRAMQDGEISGATDGSHE